MVNQLLLCCPVNFEAHTYLLLPVSEHERTCVAFCELRIGVMGPVACNALQFYLIRYQNTEYNRNWVL